MANKVSVVLKENVYAYDSTYSIEIDGQPIRVSKADFNKILQTCNYLFPKKEDKQINPSQKQIKYFS